MRRNVLFKIVIIKWTVSDYSHDLFHVRTVNCYRGAVTAIPRVRKPCTLPAIKLSTQDDDENQITALLRYIHPLKVYNTVGFSIIREFYNHHHIQF